MRGTGLTQELQSFLQYAYDHCPGWRERFEQIGIKPHQIKDESQLTMLPVLKKQELPQLQRKHPPFASLFDLNRLPERIFMSPGPIYDPQPSGADPWRFAPALQETGFLAGDIVLNTFSYHLSPAGFMFDQALRTLQATVVPTGVGNTELLVSMLRDLKATGYVGTPSYFRALMSRAEEEGLRVGDDIHIQKAFFTAEPIPPDLADWCKVRGVAFGEAYGTADAGCIAYRIHPEKGLRIGKNVLVQICDPSTGQPVADGEAGEIVVTVLDPAYPLIRFGTGDLSSWIVTEESSRLAGVLGRVGDGIKVRGMFIYQKQLEEVLKGFPEIEYFQGVVSWQGDRDHLQILLETATPVEEDWLQRVSNQLREHLRIKAEVMPAEQGVIDRSEKKLVDIRT